MARRLYKVGALVEARNTKYERGKGIILTGPHDVKNYWNDNIIENFTVHWFDRPGIIDHWEWNRDAPNGMGVHNFKMTKNQIKILRASK